MATLRVDDAAFRREREVVKEERRMRDREPAVRPAVGDHLRQRVPGASVQAPDDRQHGGPGSGLDRGRARLPQHLLRAGERHRDDRWRLRHGAGGAAGDAVFRPRAKGGPAGAARHSEGAAADAGERARSWRNRGRCRRSSSRTTSPTTGTRTRIRCTSPRRSCRTDRARGFRASWSTTSGCAVSAFGSGNIIEDPNLFYAVAHRAAGADAGGGGEGAHRRVREAEARRRQRAGSCSARKNQFARDYILGRESNEDKARHLAHAAVIHNDITTADGEFDIFMNGRRRRRPARGADLLQRDQPHGAAHRAEGRRAMTSR